jgi:hypothetical protein
MRITQKRVLGDDSGKMMTSPLARMRGLFGGGQGVAADDARREIHRSRTQPTSIQKIQL